MGVNGEGGVLNGKGRCKSDRNCVTKAERKCVYQSSINKLYICSKILISDTVILCGVWVCD